MTELMEDLEAVERLCCRLETHLEDREDLHTTAHLVMARVLWRMLRREAKRDRSGRTESSAPTEKTDCHGAVAPRNDRREKHGEL